MIRNAARALLAVVTLAVLAPALAGAQDRAVPTIAVDRAALRPGERVVLTLTGWAGRVITVSVCGNLGARASADCNQVASEGIGRNRDGSPTSRDFVVLAPPVPCPCVLRAATTTSDEVAVVPIDLLGHPVGPVVGPPGVEPLMLRVEARRAAGGILGRLRAALGGPTPYAVTVSVRNDTGRRLEGLVLAGSTAGRGGDVLDLSLPVTGAIEPGATWEHTVRSTVPAPVVGSFTWEVTASGAGPPVTASTTTRSVPLLLVLVVLALLGDVVLIARRSLARGRRRAGREIGGRSVPSPG